METIVDCLTNIILKIIPTPAMMKLGSMDDLLLGFLVTVTIGVVLFLIDVASQLRRRK